MGLATRFPLARFEGPPEVAHMRFEVHRAVHDVGNAIDSAITDAFTRTPKITQTTTIGSRSGLPPTAHG
jgi:hypothetical protein